MISGAVGIVNCWIGWFDITNGVGSQNHRYKYLWSELGTRHWAVDCMQPQTGRESTCDEAVGES